MLANILGTHTYTKKSPCIRRHVEAKSAVAFFVVVMYFSAYTSCMFMPAYFEKTALNALMRHLGKLAPEAQNLAVKSLPGPIRSSAAYKLLGGRAAATARGISDAQGHGTQHIFNVTRNAQRLSQPMGQTVQRQSTLGGLLHDVGRETEGRLKQQLGKPVFNRTQSAQHSELGGKFTKQFLNQGQNKQLAQQAGISRPQVTGAVRAHDTNAWAFDPRLKHNVAAQPTAAATYLGDKIEGFGRKGAERTVSMTEKFRDAPVHLNKLRSSNVQKYNAALDTAGPAYEHLRPSVGQFDQSMRGYMRSSRYTNLLRSGNVQQAAHRPGGAVQQFAGPALPPVPMAPAMKAAAYHMEKMAMSTDPLLEILKLIGVKGNIMKIERTLDQLFKQGLIRQETVLGTIFKLPLSKRIEAMKYLTRYLV